MERLNLRQLEIFSAVVDAGSFTAAAEKLYLAQSTVSDNVRALEELLHLKLFHRESKRRLTLTLEGKRVYRYAQDILGRCSALLLDVAVDSALELTLGASTVPAQSLLPGYMARFARENPACRCTLLCGDSAAVQQMLLNGDIHLGFVGSADDRRVAGPTPRRDPISEPIAEDRLVLITPNTPRFAALKTQGVLGRELFREPFLFRERGSGTQKVIDNYLSEIRLDPQVIHTVAYVSDPTVLQRLVPEGAGVDTSRFRTRGAGDRRGGTALTIRAGRNARAAQHLHGPTPEKLHELPRPHLCRAGAQAGQGVRVTLPFHHRKEADGNGSEPRASAHANDLRRRLSGKAGAGRPVENFRGSA